MEQTGPNTQILLRLLQENDMPDQAQELRKFLDYVTGMERKCGEILKELRQVREQLSKLEHPAAADFIKAEEKTESRVERARGQLRQLRKTIENKAKSIVDGFRRAGVSALRRTSEVLGVRNLLSSVQEELGHAASGAQRAVERLEAMGNELRTASDHLRNAGRAMAGHTPRQVEQRPEGRFQSTVLLPMRGVQKTLSKMQVATATAMYSVARFEQGPTEQGEVFALPAPEQERHTEAEAPAFTMSM